mmetsp:Transcript_27820/g.83082  ORF Transcript_27820/g.83082 Transcript_27820/m.83082 type:complete len:246 (-) Transcript_27820:66-803(-)
MCVVVPVQADVRKVRCHEIAERLQGVGLNVAVASRAAGRRAADAVRVLRQSPVLRPQEVQHGGVCHGRCMAKFKGHAAAQRKLGERLSNAAQRLLADVKAPWALEQQEAKMRAQAHCTTHKVLQGIHSLLRRQCTVMRYCAGHLERKLEALSCAPPPRGNCLCTGGAVEGGVHLHDAECLLVTVQLVLALLRVRRVEVAGPMCAGETGGAHIDVAKAGDARRRGGLSGRCHPSLRQQPTAGQEPL